MKKYIIKDIVYNWYYLGGGEWTIYQSCAQQYNSKAKAEKTKSYIIKINEPIRKKELDIIEIKGE